MHSFATVPLSYLQGLVNFYVIALGSMLSIAVCENFFFFFFSGKVVRYDRKDSINCDLAFDPSKTNGIDNWRQLITTNAFWNKIDKYLPLFYKFCTTFFSPNFPVKSTIHRYMYVGHSTKLRHTLWRCPCYIRNFYCLLVFKLSLSWVILLSEDKAHPART